MKEVWKFPIDLIDRPGTHMPRDARILCVQAQGSRVCLWAEVDTEAPLDPRYFEIHGTGHAMDTGMGTDRRYIGTVQMGGGVYVWHVYERTGV